jgi:hypothetical protein
MDRRSAVSVEIRRYWYGQADALDLSAHVALHRREGDASGQTQTWGLEAGNPQSVESAGVKKVDIQPGDKVRVRCHPLLSGASGCVLGFVTPLNGDKGRGDGIERAWN